MNCDRCIDITHSHTHALTLSLYIELDLETWIHRIFGINLLLLLLCDFFFIRFYLHGQPFSAIITNRETIEFNSYYIIYARCAVGVFGMFVCTLNSCICAFVYTTFSIKINFDWNKAATGWFVCGKWMPTNTPSHQRMHMECLSLGNAYNEMEKEIAQR